MVEKAKRTYIKKKKIKTKVCKENYQRNNYIINTMYNGL